VVNPLPIVDTGARHSGRSRNPEATVKPVRTAVLDPGLRRGDEVVGAFLRDGAIIPACAASSLVRHSGGSRNPEKNLPKDSWIPAFAGMTDD
jgi:hypothetical protein